MHGPTFVCMLALIVLPAQAAEPEDQIKYRKAVMKVIGGHMGGISAILRGKVDNSADLKAHAMGMAAASVMARGLFPEGSDFGETRTRDTVWSDAAGFASAVERFEQTASAFNSAVESGDRAAMGRAMKDLGGSCKGCHDDYRVKKN